MLSVKEIPITLSVKEIRDSYSGDFRDDVRLPVAYVSSVDLRISLCTYQADKRDSAT